jgi:hypothetical protein
VIEGLMRGGARCTRAVAHRLHFVPAASMGVLVVSVWPLLKRKTFVFLIKVIEKYSGFISA